MIAAMENEKPKDARLPEPFQIDWRTGSLGDDPRLERGTKTVGEMANVFLDEQARARMNESMLVYSVEYWKPVEEGTEGGLFWGNSTVMSGLVREEYFMTRGHFHANRNRAEYYATISGAGLLVLMNEQREGAVQQMQPGSTHYIPGRIAHRVVNTCSTPLTFLACWPSDAGYDYAAIEERGFSLRVLCRGGRPEVVANP